MLYTRGEVKEQARVSHDFRQGAAVGGDDGHAERHRLERGNAEAFHERRHHEGQGAGDHRASRRREVRVEAPDCDLGQRQGEGEQQDADESPPQATPVAGIHRYARSTEVPACAPISATIDWTCS